MSVLGYAGNVKKLWAEPALIEWVFWGLGLRDFRVHRAFGTFGAGLRASGFGGVALFRV